jgi:hypothetical protein
MKILKTYTLSVLLALCYLQSNAQTASVPLNEPNYNKPKLFADLPDKMNLNLTEAEALLNTPVGTAVNKQVTNQLRLQGTVVSVSDAQDPSVKSIVVRSSNRVGAVFTFTRIQHHDGNYSYVGRMISMQHGDAFEIVKENNQYVFK